MARTHKEALEVTPVAVEKEPKFIEPSEVSAGFTLIPTKKVAINTTVEGTGVRTKDGLFELCKYKVKA